MTRRTGGSDGGGSVLTEDGYRLMERFRAFLDEADAELARLYQKYFGDASSRSRRVATGRSTALTRPQTRANDEGRGARAPAFASAAPPAALLYFAAAPRDSMPAGSGSILTAHTLNSAVMVTGSPSALVSSLTGDSA